MKIAVIVPAYNVAHCLPQCLDTLLAQTVPVEIYCCDDGSTDGTRAVIERYAADHKNIHPLYAPHQGMTATYNHLLDALPSDVELFGIVDADDYVHPEMYEILSEALTRTQSDVAECKVAWVPAERMPPEGFSPVDPEKHEQVLDDMSATWVRRNWTSTRDWIRKWNKLYRRAAIADLRFREGLDYEDDFFFTAEVNAVIRRKVLVPRELYAYRRNVTSLNCNFDIRRYVSSVALRLRLSCETFLATGRIPKNLEREWRADWTKDAYRMLVRKNLRNNSDAALRKVLFREAGEKLNALADDFGMTWVGLNPVQHLLLVCCLRNHYRLARLLVMLT